MAKGLNPRLRLEAAPNCNMSSNGNTTSSVGATSEQREHAQQNAAPRLIADVLLLLPQVYCEKLIIIFIKNITNKYRKLSNSSSARILEYVLYRIFSGYRL